MIRLDAIGRILFGSALRRALWRSPRALLIVAALVGLLLMSVGDAFAQVLDKGEARAACVAKLQQLHQAECTRSCTLINQDIQDRGSDWYCTGNTQLQNPTFTNSALVVVVAYSQCPSSAPWDPVTQTCSAPCANKPNLGNTAWSNYNAQTFSICKDGCTYNDIGVGFTQVVDGVAYQRSTDWEASGATCSVGSGGGASAAPADGDGDGTSDGFDGSPNNPGSGGGGGADGQPQPEDGQCGGPGQPECGTPGSGSGNGNTSGGGGNCATPPSSTGDPILAQIVYQTWATRCAVEGLGTADSGNGDDGQPDWTKGNPPPTPGGDDQADIDGATRFGIGVGPSLLDETDIFGGGTCPQFSFQIAGTTISSSEYPEWCDVVAIMRALILIFGAFTALRILMGSE